MEESIGGRESLIDSLGVLPLDKKQQHFVNLLCDPKRQKASINSIAKDAGLTPVQVLELCRQANFARATAAAMSKMAEALPSVVADIASKSVDAKIECPTCFGAKLVAGTECPQCYGKGLIMQPSSLDHQKIVLESTGIIKKTGTNIQVNTQVNNNLQPSNFFSRFVRESDEAAYKVGEIIDVTPPKPEE